MWTWTTTAVSENVHIIEATAENARGGHPPFEILVQSDQHMDHDKCDRGMMRRHLQMAKDANMPVIGLGDLFCVMQGRHDPRRSAKVTGGSDRVDYFDWVVEEGVDFYRPFAEQLAVFGRGNHEQKVLKHESTDILERWAYRLGAEEGSRPFIGGYGGWVFVRLRDATAKKWVTTCKVKYFHGAGGGGPVTKGVIQTNRRAVYLPDANVVLTGHIHENWSVTLSRERVTDAGRVFIDEQLHACCPTYKEEYGAGADGWHVERGAPPKPLGALVLSLPLVSKQVYANSNGYTIQPDVRRVR